MDNFTSNFLIKQLNFKATSFNRDLVVSGSYDNKINLYKADIEKNKLNKLLELPYNGLVTDM